MLDDPQARNDGKAPTETLRISAGSDAALVRPSAMAPGDRPGQPDHTRRGVAVSLQLSATGGTAPYTWSATGLPAGLSINTTTGRITGTPTTVHTYSVTVTAWDSASRTGSTSFDWATSYLLSRGTH